MVEDRTMNDPDDRRSEWTQEMPRPTEQPRLVEYDWVNEHKPEKNIPIDLVEAILADLGEDEDDAPDVPRIGPRLN